MNPPSPSCSAAPRRLLLASAIAAMAARAWAQSTAVDQLKQLSLDQLMNTEVTSVAKYPEQLMNAPAAIEVLTNEDLARSTAATLSEAMRLADNLDVAQKDPHDWAISARGFNSNLGDKMLVLMDGRSVYTPLFAGVFWNAQDYLLTDIDRIEVISGPGGTLWGANAVNGVINITSKSARDTQGTYLEATGGSVLEDEFGARYGGMLAPNVYFRVYGKYFGEGPATLGSGQSGADGWHQGQGGFRIDALPTPDTTWTVQGDGYGGNLDIQSGGEARISGANVLSRWSRTFSADSNVSLQVYADRTHVSDPFGATSFGPAGYLKDNLDTYDLDFQHSFRAAPGHRVIWGFGYRLTRDDEMQEAPNFGFLPPHENESLINLFAQDEWALTDQLAVIGGSKVEHNGYTGWEVEPNGRLRWNPAANQMVWAAVSRAVRTPSRLDRDLAEPVAHPLIEGSAGFDSETLIAYELGYRAQITSRASVSVSTYYNEYDHLRGLSLTPVTLLPLVYANTLEGHTFGGEISGDYQVADWLRLHAGYNLLREHLRVKPGATDFFNALDETEDPEHQTALRASVDLPGKVQWDTAFRWVDSLIVDNGGLPATVPSYAEMDMRIAWPLTPSTELSLNGQNLLHDHHAEYGVPGPMQEEIRRNVYVKLAWRY